MAEDAHLSANSNRRALALIGDRWTLLILRDAFLGVHQFSAWQERLGVTPGVLAKRLKHLVSAGIFRKVRVRAAPPRTEYHLTEKGLGIYPVALMVLRWEQRWFDEGQTVLLRHARCGQMMMPRLTCRNCAQEIDPHEVRYADGPGAGPERREEGGRRQRRPSITARDRRGAQGFLEHAIDIFGDRWSWEVVGAAFLGRRRFDEIADETGAATNILSDRLRRLEKDDILQRREYQTRPPRHEYRLTDKGRDLYGATVMLMRWGDRWLADDKGPPLRLTHVSCGSELEPEVTCSACGGVLDPHEVMHQAG
jgi:DNA-binding HxlR family transcriptional regulator